MFSRFHKSTGTPRTQDFERLADEVAGLRADIKSLVDATVTTSRSTVVTSDASKTESQLKNDIRGNPEDCDVMISLNCKTMLQTAQRIRAFLEQNGVKVWLCVNMTAGADFRDEIISAVDACEVFLPLINEAWCESKECKYEFNYGFRKHLTSEPQRPMIVPMCFPDLQWNAHAHVRALLANTNALVYKEEEEDYVLERLKDALRSCGLKVKNKIPSTWTEDDVEDFLRLMLLRPFVKEGERIDGKQLLDMDSHIFEEKVLLAAKQAKKWAEELEEQARTEEEVVLISSHDSTDEGDLSISSVSGEMPVEVTPSLTTPDKLHMEGMYKVIAKTTNYYDQNITESNVFLVTLSKNGIGSTGCAWNAGTIHNNYDGVTCVWQGEYRESDGSFFFDSLYSNQTHEQYSGRFERYTGNDGYLYCRGFNCKYAWFGYGRESYGMLDMYMCKLSGDEVKDVKNAMQSLAVGETNAIPMEAVMQNIGPTISWNDFHQVVDKCPKLQVTEGFCSVPPYNSTVCLQTQIAVHLELPLDLNTSQDLFVSIVPEGSVVPDQSNIFKATPSIITRGYVFPKDKVPKMPGRYEIALFHKGNVKVAGHPISITQDYVWKRSNH